MQSRWVFTNPQESYLTKAQVGAGGNGVGAGGMVCKVPCCFVLHPETLHPCAPTTHPPQEVSLNYHMKCEQYAHSASRSFFNFNGTAGGWAGGGA